MRFERIIHNAFEILLPRCCLVCKRPLLQRPLCLRCLPRSNPSFINLEDWPRLPFRSLYSIWSYAGDAQRFITAMKYGPSLSLAKISGELLAQSIANNSLHKPCNLIVPIPSSRESFRTRLFNQSAVLAKACSQRSGAAWHANALRHRGCSAPQASLDSRERFKNVQNSFSANPALVAHKNIMLVDDVATTGATISSAARALRAAGAAEVHAVALSQSEGLQAHWAWLEEAFGLPER